MSPDTPPIQKLESLTALQAEVLNLYCQGSSAEDIAQNLASKPSPSTVYSHLRDISIKLGVESLPRGARQRELVRLWLESKSRGVSGVSSLAAPQSSSLVAHNYLGTKEPSEGAIVADAVVVVACIHAAAQLSISQSLVEHNAMLRAFHRVAHEALSEYLDLTHLDRSLVHVNVMGERCFIVLHFKDDDPSEIHALRLAVRIKQGWINSNLGKRLAQAHAIGLQPLVDLRVGIDSGKVIFAHDVWSGAFTPEGAVLREAEALANAAAEGAPGTYVLVKLEIREKAVEAGLGVQFGPRYMVKLDPHLEGLYQVTTYPVTAWREFRDVQDSLAPGASTALEHFIAGVASQRSNLLDRAIEEYLLALTVLPDYADAWNNLGVAYLAQSNYASAMRAFDEVLKREPNDPLAWYNLGLTQRGLGNGRLALDAFQQSLALRSNNLEALNETALAANELRDFGLATQLLERAVRLDANHGDSHYNLACTFALSGRVEAAIKELKEALQLDRERYAAHARIDNDFSEIRNLPQFETLIRE